MRTSKDKRDGAGLIDGFDYDLQVWVRNRTVLNCGHPRGALCCNARRFAGADIREARALAKEAGLLIEAAAE